MVTTTARRVGALAAAVLLAVLVVSSVGAAAVPDHHTEPARAVLTAVADHEVAVVADGLRPSVPAAVLLAVLTVALVAVGRPGVAMGRRAVVVRGQPRHERRWRARKVGAPPVAGP